MLSRLHSAIMELLPSAPHSHTILDVRRLRRLRYSTGLGAIDAGEYVAKARGVQHGYR